jgi:hypothetical protein
MQPRFRFPSFAAIPLLALAVACGGGGGSSGPFVPVADWYVSATAGNDSFSGSPSSPLKTLTFAMAVATNGDVVYAYPGTFDAANGEAFPIVVPTGVTLLGDEANKGNGITPTEIVGGGLAPAPNPGSQLSATIVPGAGSTVAGFRIENPMPSGPPFPEAMILPLGSVTLRNNRIEGSDDGVYAYNGVGLHTIVGNVIQGNAVSGLVFNGGGAGSRVESNRIVGNLLYGVEVITAGADLGGGAAGSLGLNVFSCNTVADVRTNTPAIVIPVCFDAWDHLAPLVTPGPGVDISNGSGATFVTTGATLNPSGCP